MMVKCASLVARGTVVASLFAVFVAPGYSQMRVGRTQTVIRPAPTWGWAYDPALMPYWTPWYSPCYPFASCSAYQQFQLQERRRQRIEELRREPPPPLPSFGKENREGLTAGRGMGQAPPRPNDADVQPRYRESGHIREKYRESGELLPEFLDGSLRPPR